MISVHYPGTAVDAASVRAVAGAVERTGAGRLWMGQSLLVDPHQLFAYCSALGFTIAFGTSVALMPLRHPVDAALQARSVARLSGRPMVAGYGPGGTDLQRELLGTPYPRPLDAVEDYVSRMRSGLDDGGPGVEIGLGVLRPAMARLAGRVADVAITWLCPAAYIRDVLVPELRRGAASAGRPVPRVVSVVHAAQARPRRDAAEYAYSVCVNHLGAPHYVAMLRAAGLQVDPDRRQDAARQLVASRTFVHGDLDEIALALQEYAEAGVDETVLNLSAVAVHRGPLVAARELTSMLTALGRPTEVER